MDLTCAGSILLSSPDPSTALSQTPLAPLHERLGARMVPFAGYRMPVSYPAGILAEHNACRTRAALFDVSHMGQLLLTGPDADAALERLVPSDIAGLALDHQRYTFLTTAEGGILDDIMVTRRAEGLALVVNAANSEVAIAHLQATLAGRCQLSVPGDLALLALQGPGAAAAVQQLAPALAKLPFMAGLAVEIAGTPCYATRSGYTGEDGYEISLPAQDAIALAERLLALPGVSPAGLGARDTLRLEAGLCLHGQDIDASTTPIEAGLAWAIQPVRRPGGARAGGYPGAAVIEAQLAVPPAVVRVGLAGSGRQPVRAGTRLFQGGDEVGLVTSGSFSPTLGHPIAMARLRRDVSTPDCEVEAEVRGQRVPLRRVPLPFVPHHRVRNP